MTRSQINRALLLMGLSLVSALPVTAQSGNTKALPTMRTATTDLNGDGKPEQIDISYTNSTPRQLALSINGAKLIEKDKGYDEADQPSFRIVTLDNTSKTRQIAVELMSPGGQGETLFYRWDGRAIRRVGAVPNAENVTGNRVVKGNLYMDFWTCAQRFVLDPRTQTLKFVRQPTYKVGVSATVKQAFSLRKEHTAGSSAAASLSPGTKIELVEFWSPTARPEDSARANAWFLIKATDGKTGWARLDTFEKKVEGLIYGG